MVHCCNESNNNLGPSCKLILHFDKLPPPHHNTVAPECHLLICVVVVGWLVGRPRLMGWVVMDIEGGGCGGVGGEKV